MIVADSDVLIEILDRKSDRGDEALERLVGSGEEVATTSVSLHEVLYGLNKYGKPVDEVLLLSVLAYSKKEALISSKIELEAERKGKKVSRTDAIIASIAISNNAKLFTFNKKHFSIFSSFGLELF